MVFGAYLLLQGQPASTPSSPPALPIAPPHCPGSRDRISERISIHISLGLIASARFQQLATIGDYVPSTRTSTRAGITLLCSLHKNAKYKQNQGIPSLRFRGAISHQYRFGRGWRRGPHSSGACNGTPPPPSLDRPPPWRGKPITTAGGHQPPWAAFGR